MTLQEIRTKTGHIFMEYGVSYAAVFGSVARGEDRPESDVDFLVRLGRPMGMIEYMRLIDSLEQSLRKKVDVVTEQSLNKHVRPFVTSNLKVIYER